jgi:hypothetical protein
LQHAEPTFLREKCAFDVGLAISSAERLGKTQNVFLVDYINDKGPEYVRSADHEITYGFGSGKAMAALYHAV